MQPRIFQLVEMAWGNALGKPAGGGTMARPGWAKWGVQLPLSAISGAADTRRQVLASEFTRSIH